MHKIYIEKRCIIICPPHEQALTDPNAVRFCPGANMDIHALTGMFESSGTLHRIYIPVDDVEETYRKICAELVELNAGAGLSPTGAGTIFS